MLPGVVKGAGVFGCPVVVVVVVAAVSMVVKQVSAHDFSLCLSMRSLWSSLMAFAIFYMMSSMLKKVSASKESAELVGCPEISWNRGVFVRFKGV